MKRATHLLLTLVFTVLSLGYTNAQSKYVDSNGTIVFEASEQLFEPVRAVNESATMIFDTSTGKIASLALMKGFRFKNSLMEEHFNENYAESETFPKTTFRGTVLDFDVSLLDQNKDQFIMQGILVMRGKEKAIRTPIQINTSGDFIIVKGVFTVTPGDFDIEIPKIVENKIAKEIQINFDFKLSEK